ncbi:hypothetical protein CGCTS75_v007653 [Colletotrichum tropicale]|nr:hypothetical protein CGCTS75_v007653 [Colletotrichum tropicale]
MLKDRLQWFFLGGILSLMTALCSRNLASVQRNQRSVPIPRLVVIDSRPRKHLGSFEFRRIISLRESQVWEVPLAETRLPRQGRIWLMEEVAWQSQ